MLDNKARIRQSLQSLSVNDFGYQATKLLHTLGYESERIVHDRFVTASEFIRDYPVDRTTQSENKFLTEVKSVRILFQLTDTEIDTRQERLFNEKTFDSGKNKSFVFVAVELASSKYPRGQYALFTREINKRFGMPVIVLFKTISNLYTISFVHRRENRRDSTRDVLGPISLIREIRSKEPNRAHIDILEALMMDERLKWMESHNKPKNFDGLLDSWLNALDVEELNKRFYCELFAWFLHAVKHSRLPQTNLKSLKPEEHTLRLITRLLFIWFIKQKGLVSDDLFNERKIQTLLKNYRHDGDQYYRVVLQNLFFATLNTKIDNRNFDDDPNNTSSYHYIDEMKKPEKLYDLFNQTPFINGGLFDCLDDVNNLFRVDYFVNDPDQRRDYSIPNFLFFSSLEEGELKRVGERKSNSNISGLFTIFNKYHFTIEENTPLEQEVALDPELLGKVFENLLAAYNPETRETVRNQTGSYYTPRKIVDYMVDESLRLVLTDKVSKTIEEDTQVKVSKKQLNILEDKIRTLLDYSNDLSNYKLSISERKHIVRAISEIKIIDPAVGSGAFPMAVLHKLTLILNRIDDNNVIWERLQRDMAKEKIKDVFEHEDKKLREIQLQHINIVFDEYRSKDFGRKLCLIQNNIYGVDIQPTAIQIAKLRFFISLAIEQEPTTNPNNNYGIHPLPNLETRFVAADTLMPLNTIDKYIQETLGQTAEVKKLEKLLLSNREQYFHANTTELKSKYKKHDAKLRKQLISILSSENKKAGHLDKVIQWDPYNQNEYANWFDAKYMFGTDKFDIVIGNPPYIQLQKDSGKLGKKYEDLGYVTLDRRGDIYQLFFERGCEFTSLHGVLTYITSNSWLRADSGSKTRSFLSNDHTPLKLIEMGENVFETAIVDSCIFLLHNDPTFNDLKSFPAIDIENYAYTFPPDTEWKQIRPHGKLYWSILSSDEQSIMNKIYNGVELKDHGVQINRGVTTGYNEAFIIDTKIKNLLIDQDPKSVKIIKPILRGKDVKYYHSGNATKWLIYTRKGINIKLYPAIYRHLQQYRKQLSKKSGTNKWYELQASPSDTLDKQFSKEKLLWIELVKKGRFSYDDGKLYGEATTFLLTGNNIKFLCAILNSDLITWFFQHMAVTSGMGTHRWKKAYVEKIPIPIINKQQQEPFIILIDKIIRLKTNESNADTLDLECQINNLVYDLYGLTKSQIKLVQDYLTLNSK